MNIRFLAFAIIIFFFSSCIKKDQPVILPPHGDAITQSLNCGADYSTQFFYSFKDGKVVHSGAVDSWHLAFETTPDGFGVFMNGGVGMALIPTGKNQFKEVVLEEYENQPWLQDDPAGQASKSAIGNWRQGGKSESEVYLLRLDALGKKMLAFKLLSVTDVMYEFEIFDMNSGQYLTCKVGKNASAAYSYYNLNTFHTITDVEPAKDSWDILFTRYGYTFYDQTPALPYIVTGVLSNPVTKVFSDSSALFYDIEADIMVGKTFSTDRDIIGFNWKQYDFDLGVFNVRQDYNFIIRTQHNEVYKMRFLSFYDDHGVKGSPTFEYRLIQ